jgi:hypothetical protein
MQQDITLWHYLAALGLFCLLGIAAHICRAMLGPPAAQDRLRPGWPSCPRPLLGTDAALLATDLDEHGRYRLLSRRNLVTAVALSAGAGLLVMVMFREVALLMAHVVEVAVLGVTTIL